MASLLPPVEVELPQPVRVGQGPPMDHWREGLKVKTRQKPETFSEIENILHFCKNSFKQILYVDGGIS
jgi:hypothetical protein